eukprot:2499308-Prorocentrum_lima.AAC.1
MVPNSAASLLDSLDDDFGGDLYLPRSMMPNLMVQPFFLDLLDPAFEVVPPPLGASIQQHAFAMGEQQTHSQNRSDFEPYCLQ